jgi:hypothetical protein
MTHLKQNTKPDLAALAKDGWQERSAVERRSDNDKRVSPNPDYFQKGGKERRRSGERRQNDERRDGWLRIGKWRSVSVFSED